MCLETEFESYKTLLVVVVSFELIYISLGRVSSSLAVYLHLTLRVWKQGLFGTFTSTAAHYLLHLQRWKDGLVGTSTAAHYLLHRQRWKDSLVGTSTAAHYLLHRQRRMSTTFTRVPHPFQMPNHNFHFFNGMHLFWKKIRC